VASHSMTETVEDGASRRVTFCVVGLSVYCQPLWLPGTIQVSASACRSPVEVHDQRTIPFPTGVFPMGLLDDLDPGSWDLVPCAFCKTT
jgi:hypothetical protein